MCLEHMTAGYLRAVMHHGTKGREGRREEEKEVGRERKEERRQGGRERRTGGRERRRGGEGEKEEK